jgi:hypothetical protein
MAEIDAVNRKRGSGTGELVTILASEALTQKFSLPANVIEVAASALKMSHLFLLLGRASFKKQPVKNSPLRSKGDFKALPPKANS